MKLTKTKYYAVAVALITFAVACSKPTDDKGVLPDATVSIVGKWNFTSEQTVIKDRFGRILSDTTDTTFPGWYADFRSNDSLYSKYYDEHDRKYDYDTSRYTIKGNLLITSYTGEFGEEIDTAVIQTLTKNELVIFEKYEDEFNRRPAIYEETHILHR